MSPEQARGQEIDRRTDIWAFGCVVYEMVVGRPAFAGPTTADTIAAVMERPVNWTAIPADAPPAITRVLRRCLQRDPKQRLRDIADARLELEDTTTDAEALPVPQTESGCGSGRQRACSRRASHRRADDLDDAAAVRRRSAGAFRRAAILDDPARWTRLSERGDLARRNAVVYVASAAAGRSCSSVSELHRSGADCGDDERRRSFLLAGWSVGRLLRRWATQEGQPRRRRTGHAV